MPIYIGDKEIATVFKGDTELDNIQLGDQQQWIGIIVTPDPSITYVSHTSSSLTFDLTNNHEKTVTIFYEIDDNTPDQNSVVVAANATQRVTLSGLSFNTTYTLFAYALEAEQLPSNTISNTQTTQDVTENPTISNVNPGSDRVTFSLKNNDNVTATIYYEVNDSTPDLTVSVGAGSTVSRTITGLNSQQGYTLYARALASGKVTSSTVSTGFTTIQPSTIAPTIIYVDKSQSSFVFKLKNNESSTATVYWGNNDSTPNNSFTLGANQTSGNITVSGLSKATFYTLYAKAQVSGKLLSGNRTQQYWTTGDPYQVKTGNSLPLYYQETTFMGGVQRDIHYNSNGSKMYILSQSSGQFDRGVYQFSLSTNNDPRTATYDNVGFSFRPWGFSPTAWAWNPNGTRVIVNINEVFYEFSLSSYNLSTISFVRSFNPVSQDDDIDGIQFNNNGTKLYAYGRSNDRVFEYNCPTAYSLSGISFTGVTSPIISNVYKLDFNSTGTKMYMSGSSDMKVYNLSSAFNIASAVRAGSSEDLSYGSSNLGAKFNNNGTFVSGFNNSRDDWWHIKL